LCIAAHKKGISLESKRKRHPGKGRKNHHGIGRCFDARLDMPKAIAKGDDICALRHIKSDDNDIISDDIDILGDACHEVSGFP